MTRALRWIHGAPLALMLVSCADAAQSGAGNPLSPVYPGAAGEIRTTTAEYGSYPGESEVPPGSRFARVYSHAERVSWSGQTANAYASMEYFGNRGEQALEVSVLHGYSTVGSVRAERHAQSFFPDARVMGNPLSFTAAERCGQTATFIAHHRAKTIILMNSGITTIWSDQAYGQASAAQPDCAPPPTAPCDPNDDGTDYVTGTDAPPERSRDVSPYNFAYDPYDPAYESPSSNCGAGGETPPPGEPEQTFPELCTALGGKLYYDYGCIEKWNAEKGQWEPEWCGTYAVCET